MALDVKTTPTAENQMFALAKTSPAGWVELDQKIEIVSGADLPGKQHRLDYSDLIASIDYVHELYFINPSSPGPYFACLYKQGDSDILILALHDKSFVSRIDQHFKYAVGKSAASELGLVHPNINVN